MDLLTRQAQVLLDLGDQVSKSALESSSLSSSSDVVNHSQILLRPTYEYHTFYLSPFVWRECLAQQHTKA